MESCRARNSCLYLVVHFVSFPFYALTFFNLYFWFSPTMLTELLSFTHEVKAGNFYLPTADLIPLICSLSRFCLTLILAELSWRYSSANCVLICQSALTLQIWKSVYRVKHAQQCIMPRVNKEWGISFIYIGPENMASGTVNYILKCKHFGWKNSNYNTHLPTF